MDDRGAVVLEVDALAQAVGGHQDGEAVISQLRHPCVALGGWEAPGDDQDTGLGIPVEAPTELPSDVLSGFYEAAEHHRTELVDQELANDLDQP